MIVVDEVRIDDDHRYWHKEHGHVPGVTEILHRFRCVDDFDAPWIRDRAAYKRELGSLVHQAIHLLEKGTLDPFSLDPAVEPYVYGYEAFRDRHGFQVLRHETLVYSETRRFAGTLDAVWLWNGEEWVIDFKTGAVKPGAELQTAAYAECLPPTPTGRPRRRAALRLYADRPAELIPFRGGFDGAIFNGLAATFHWQLNKGLVDNWAA